MDSRPAGGGGRGRIRYSLKVMNVRKKIRFKVHKFYNGLVLLQSELKTINMNFPMRRKVRVEKWRVSAP